MPHGDIALERVRHLAISPDSVEDLGDGVFQAVNPPAGLGDLTLRSGEALPFGLAFTTAAENRAGYAALRAVQYAVDDGGRVLVGGQTYVFGEVEGWTADRSVS